MAAFGSVGALGAIVFASQYLKRRLRKQFREQHRAG